MRAKSGRFPERLREHSTLSCRSCRRSSRSPDHQGHSFSSLFRPFEALPEEAALDIVSVFVTRSRSFTQTTQGEHIERSSLVFVALEARFTCCILKVPHR
ncbi:hypothetical protein NDU88_012556 [Pleurodeles waltl]|uniref:Uncharacterized protein n=1 Tax=Pleurodeles waltl TaxID=8319 RepID=A0AAV7R661_PLEWA|nr:hypothetical protein NDU88_012556 [Pleurodeles waltl]